MEERPRSHEGDSRRWSLGGLILLLALLAPPLWLRARPEHTLWLDEIHSLQLSQLPVSRLLDEAAEDFHPPGYALALKVWLKAARLAGLAPGTSWARGLNVLAWVGLTVCAWLPGGWLLGGRGGLLLTLCVSGSAAAAVVVRDLRSYAFAYVALTLAVLLLAVLESGRHPRRRQGWLWAGYALALTAALWSHLLAAPAAALLALCWLIGALRRRRRAGGARPGFGLVGLVAQLAPWLLFLPWLVRVPRQVGELRQAAASWMTPPTVANLLRVFDWWIPLGRISPPSSATGAWLTVLGALAVIVPLAMGGAGLLRGRGSRPAATLARLALPAAIGSVVVYWSIARLGLATTFHAPRYPLLVAGVLAAGLVGAALCGTRKVHLAAFALVPWLLAAFVGQWLALRQESAVHGLAAFRPRVERLAGGPGSAVFVSPSELIPFVRRTFAGLRLLPVERLVCSPPAAAVVLDVNPWPALDRTRDRVLERAITSGLLASRIERVDWHDTQTDAVLYRLDGIDGPLAAELCDRGLRPPSLAPAAAVAVAAPEDQLSGDGWSYLEFGEGLHTRRWATRAETRIRFDRRVPAGRYHLRLRGVRLPYPRPTLPVRLRMAGSDLDAALELPAGPIDLTLPLTLRRARRPVLAVRHPVWSPATATGSPDKRQLTFLFESAWLSPGSVEP